MYVHNKHLYLRLSASFFFFIFFPCLFFSFPVSLRLSVYLFVSLFSLPLSDSLLPWSRALFLRLSVSIAIFFFFFLLFLFLILIFKYIYIMQEKVYQWISLNWNLIFILLLYLLNLNFKHLTSSAGLAERIYIIIAHLTLNIT